MAAGATHTHGQRHDRIPDDGDIDVASAARTDPRPVGNDISIAARMASAVTGSVLTSLLGRHMDNTSYGYTLY